MEKIITMQNLYNFAYCNHNICTKPIKGIVVSFFGLYCCDMYDDSNADGKRYAKEGILYLVPYQNPWAWMNRQNVDYTDELLDVLFKEYDLPEDLPVISTGGSMGGLSALVYMAYAKRTPVACVANCPVCDMPFHFTERPDLPRTIYSAIYTYDCTLDEALRSLSPLHLADKLPKESKYYIFHCDKDGAVNKEKHSDRLVEKMKGSHTVEYFAVPGRGHCDLTPEMWEKYHECAIKSVLEA
ncbi:MAG: prolyl oligopeptidase family serine peptidase [Clostridia bacterium]|nr:prolyl oligopeptidase family serine peptidase [Clostridia bacterium]